MLERLKSISLEKKIAVGLVIVIILLLGRGYVSYRSTADLIDRDLRVAQTHQVRESIERLLYQLEDIEDTQRLDLFTGEHHFLQSFPEANTSIDEVLRDLATLTSDDQIQQQHLLTLRYLIDLRMTQLKDMIELRNAGRIEADEQRTRQYAGKETMDEILMILGNMREQEQTLLVNWSKQADSAASFTHTLNIVGTIGTVVFAVGGGWLIFYDLSKRRQAETAVRMGQARQDLILHSLPVVMYSAKPSGDYGALWVSENIEAVTGYAPEYFLNDSSLWASRLHPHDQEKTLMEFDTLHTAGILATEYRWQTRDGEYRWFHNDAVLIRRPNGTPEEIIGLWTDVTVQRHASEMIQRQAEVIDLIQESVISIDLNGYVTSWNQGAVKLLGYTSEEAIGKHISLVYPPEDRAFLEDDVLGPVKVKGTHQIEVRRRTKSGALRFAQLSLTLVRDETGSPTGIVGYSMDITDRKRGEEALLNSRNQLAALAVRLESVREEERTRIALEVHDVLGQALTGLKLDVSWIHKRLIESNGLSERSVILSRLESSLALLDSTIQSVREIATTLRPGVLDQLGLEDAVEWQAREFRHRTGIACTTIITPTRIGVGTQQSTTLFRILQEVLTNVIRHAHATHVDIRLEQTGENVTLEVTDNGQGMTAAAQSGPKAFGLLGMRLRAQQEGGRLTIQSVLGIGTTITVNLPLVSDKP